MKTIGKIALSMLAILFFATVSVPAKAQLLDFEELGYKHEYKSLKEAMLEPTNVYKLSLINQDIKYLPEEVAALTNLQFINLSYNKNLDLEQVFSIISRLPNIQFIALDGTNLKEIPVAISYCKNLKVLGLDNNREMNLMQICEQLTNLKELQHLYMANSNITTLPKEIGKLVNLEYLYLNQNKLTELPKEFYNLGNLEFIHLSGNKISENIENQLRQNLPNAIISY